METVKEKIQKQRPGLIQTESLRRIRSGTGDIIMITRPDFTV